MQTRQRSRHLARPLLATLLLAALLLATLPFAASAKEGGLASAPASAETLSLDQALKNFAAPITKATVIGQESALGEAGASFADWRNTQSQLSNLQSYFDNNDYSSALSQARQYARQAATPEVRQRWTDLITALETEQKKAELIFAAKVDAALQRTTAALLDATKPAELDPLIGELATLQESRGNNTPRTQRLYGRLNTASSFLTEWQTMLADLDAGDTDSVRQTLRNLASNSSRDRPLTRAQIFAFGARLKLLDASLADAMARIDPVLKAAGNAVLAAKTAAELEPHINALGYLRNESQNSSDDRLRPAADRIDQSLDLLQTWQRFLSATETRDIATARRILNDLEGTNNPVPAFPSRVEIVARAGVLLAGIGGDTDSLLAKADWKSLPELRDFFVYEHQRANGRRSLQLDQIIAQLDYLIAARSRLDRGEVELGRELLRPGKVRDAYYSVSALALPAGLIALRETWLFEAMPALTGLADLPARKGDESAADYARRQFDAALAAADWARAYRFALLERDLLPPDVLPCGEREKLTGSHPAVALAAFLNAEKLEQAAQLPAAAAAYRESLAAGAPPTLEAILITRLRALPSAPLP